MFEAKLKTRYMPEDMYELQLAKYDGGAPALRIFDRRGQPMMTVSVNVDRLPAKGAIFIKDWSENEGIREALEKANLISAPIGHVTTGFVEATEHMMIGELYDEWRKANENA